MKIQGISKTSSSISGTDTVVSPNDTMHQKCSSLKKTVSSLV